MHTKGQITSEHIHQPQSHQFLGFRTLCQNIVLYAFWKVQFNKSLTIKGPTKQLQPLEFFFFSSSNY
uniref:Uncharacterized protein n=1 Tax=Rhizophora mucronata TaxID=61149 RepID=A0A2P2P2I6_RHIMU